MSSTARKIVEMLRNTSDWDSEYAEYTKALAQAESGDELDLALLAASSAFRGQEEALKALLYCEACRKLWASTGQLPVFERLMIEMSLLSLRCRVEAFPAYRSRSNIDARMECVSHAMMVRRLLSNCRSELIESIEHFCTVQEAGEERLSQEFPVAC